MTPVPQDTSAQHLARRQMHLATGAPREHGKIQRHLHRAGIVCRENMAPSGLQSLYFDALTAPLGLNQTRKMQRKIARRTLERRVPTQNVQVVNMENGALKAQRNAFHARHVNQDAFERDVQVGLRVFAKPVHLASSS